MMATKRGNPLPLSRTEWLAAVDAILAEDVAVLRDRPDSRVLRVSTGKRTVISKVWAREGLRGTLRRLSRTSSCRREWRSMKRLRAAGLNVPSPLGIGRLPASGAPYTDVLFMEDIGESQIALDHVKQLIDLEDYDQLRRVEHEIIELTKRMLEAGVVDTDHGFGNIVVPTSGEVFRIDFELAKRVWFPRLRPSLSSRMLGRLLLTHIFSVQPDTERASEFAHHLHDQIRPSRRVGCETREYVNAGLAVQRQRCGMDIQVNLPW